MYVLRTVRRQLPIFESKKLQDVVDALDKRARQYGKDKYEIFDCVEKELVDVKDIEGGHSSGFTADVSEPVSEDSHRTLYEALGDSTESSSDSPY